MLESFISYCFDLNLNDPSPDAMHNSSAIVIRLLSVSLADGLSRIGSEYRVRLDDGETIPWNRLDSRNVTVCSNKWYSQGPSFYFFFGQHMIFNWTYEQLGQFTNSYSIKNNFGKTGPVMESFPEPENVDQVWTRVDLQLKRYGYGYGFESASVITAAVILVLEGVVILIHCLVLVIHGKVFNFMDTLGDLTALCLGSGTDRNPRGSSVKINSKTWWQPVSLRAADSADGTSRLELCVGTGTEDSRAGVKLSRVKTGERYD